MIFHHHDATDGGLLPGPIVYVIFTLTHCSLGDLDGILKIQIPVLFYDWYLQIFSWSYLQMIAMGPYWWLISSGSGNGLVPSGNKSLPEPISTQFHATIWHHWPQWVNLLFASDSLWHHKTCLTLVQVMACCLTAPNHNLNQCWLTLQEVLWHSLQGNIPTTNMG